MQVPGERAGPPHRAGIPPARPPWPALPHKHGAGRGSRSSREPMIPAGARRRGTPGRPRPGPPAHRSGQPPHSARWTVPCHRPSRPKACAGGADGRLAKLTSKLARTARSPTFISSSRRCWSRIRSASQRIVQRSRAASRAAQILMARGSPAQATSSSAVASGSAAARVGPDDAAEQGERLAVVEDVQMHETAADQVGQAAAAGHDHRAGSAAGQQWPYLRPHRAHCRAATSIRRPLSRVRYSAARSSSLTGICAPSSPRSRRNRASTSACRQRLGTGAEQVHVQLAVRVLGAHPVRGMDRQGGLAQAAGAGDQGDRYRARIVAGTAGGQQPAQLARRAARAR